jgi:hypothetical protein
LLRSDEKSQDVPKSCHPLAGRNQSQLKKPVWKKELNLVRFWGFTVERETV